MAFNSKRMISLLLSLDSLTDRGVACWAPELTARSEKFCCNNCFFDRQIIVIKGERDSELKVIVAIFILFGV